jgi:porphobilinogen synthase
MSFPKTRMMRYRQSAALRACLQEVQLRPEQFIMPIFVNESLTSPKSIPSLKGVFQHGLNSLLTEVEACVAVGIEMILLFGIPSKKDDYGSASYADDGIIQKAIKKIKAAYPDLIVIADCCLCEYTDHGHCGVMTDNQLDHTETLAIYQKIAVSYAKAGVDIVAPSGMMDGQVGAIRTALDKEGFSMVMTMAYSAKYASCFYGPFRDAAGSTDTFNGDRKHHQMGISQKKEAKREVELDVAEGADFVIIKPAMMYMDIISMVKSQVDLPVVAYQVSGEYAMLTCASDQGIVEEKDAFYESFIGLKRAGADFIISYYAKQMAKELNQ